MAHNCDLNRELLTQVFMLVKTSSMLHLNLLPCNMQYEEGLKEEGMETHTQLEKKGERGEGKREGRKRRKKG